MVKLIILKKLQKKNSEYFDENMLKIALDEFFLNLNNWKYLNELDKNKPL